MIPDSREAQWSESDEAVLNSILDMLAADRPEGLNWPGVARLVRKRIRLLADVLGSPRLQDQKHQEDTRVDRQRDPTDSPTASENQTTPTRFRKKPVVIEATQWDESLATLATLRARGLVAAGFTRHRDRPDECKDLCISTLEGAMRAERGDWIIRGIKGEFYPCKPDIFEATYEPASAEVVSPQPIPAEDHLDIYVPGVQRCPKCDFELTSQTLFMRSGDIGMTRAQALGEELEPCPNDGTPMVKVRWSERAQENQRAHIKLIDDILALTGAKSLPDALDGLKRSAEVVSQPPQEDK